MDEFPPLTNEQRRLLVSYYRLYIAETKNELFGIRRLLKANNEILELLD